MNCLNCGNRGKKVKPITLDSLLKDAAKSRITDAVYYFCDSLNCDLVYFAEDGSTFAKDDLMVRVGVKEPPGTGPRQVCYCFDHTIEAIEAEVKAVGTSIVLGDIKTRMKDGCWCEKTSPAGGCCLGIVAKYINAAVDEFGPSSGIGLELQAGRVEEEHEDCCTHSGCAGGATVAEGVAHMANEESRVLTNGKSTEKAGLFAAGGAITAAILSSACCWLPLLLLAFGASVAGVSGWFERYRLIFLGVTALMLAGGFYLVYFRAPQCAADGSGACCESTGRGMKRFTKGMLWVSTVVVIAFAAFPNYAGYVIRAGNADNSIADEATLANLPKVSLEIEGMTCDACAAGLEKSLGKLDGVAQAKVNFKSKTADIWLTEDATSQTESETKAMLDTVAEAGFSGKVVDPGG